MKHLNKLLDETWRSRCIAWLSQALGAANEDPRIQIKAQEEEDADPLRSPRKSDASGIFLGDTIQILQETNIWSAILLDL